MNPLVMSVLLTVGWLSFCWSAWMKFKVLLKAGPAPRFDRLYERTVGTIVYAFGQARMPRYPVAGISHMLIFWGFMVLLLRSLTLWGRGYDETFDLWVLGDNPLGMIYGVCKDLFVLAVFGAATVALVNRLVNRKGSASRMTHTFEAYLILMIIWSMMVADVLYDWADIVHHARGTAGAAIHFTLVEPLGSWLATIFPGGGMGDATLQALRHGGYWAHSALVLIFLNILPYSKHFHVVTSIPNVFFRSLEPPGRIAPIPKIEEQEKFGVATIDQLSWKAVLDLYSCTECGRCSDNCPAWTTGKLLSPRQFSIDLKHHLYNNLEKLIGYDEQKQAAEGGGDAGAPAHPPLDAPLVPDVVKEQVVWACTTCRACEDACPVFITYVDKMVDLRRHLVLERGEIPGPLSTTLQGIEMNSNPWNLSAMDRTAWAEGLDVPRVADDPKVDYLLWVGCAPAYDQRAQKVMKAFVQLLKKAGVRFAILGDEEKCTGDIARRAGNEYLFYELAKANIETIDRYGVKRIVTVCPHCYNTLAHEYRDFGGNYMVLTHAELLLSLIEQGKLKPAGKEGGAAKVVYHDSCYLGRYNEIYDQPREVLRRIPGVELVESDRSRNKGLCCGGGGAQAFKEEEEAREGAPEPVRVNERRTDQLLATGASTVATACPYCMLMLTDGIKGRNKDEEVRQLDIAEILLERCN